MVKRRWRGRRDTRGINKEDDGEELGRERRKYSINIYVMKIYDDIWNVAC